MVSQTPRFVRLALALALAASVVVLSACGSSSDSSSSGSTSSSSSPSEGWVTSTPAGSGTLDKISWNLPYGEPFTLDWPTAASFSENTVLANVCESLIRLGPEFEYEPGLAKSWESPNPTTWIYEMQPGLKFSDGKPVTTEDVIFSLERNMDPEVGSFWSPWFENVKTIEATGKNQITVKLSRPDALFNEFLATAGGVVGEKAYVEKEGKKYGTSEGGVMCVGPYELTDWTPGKGITIKANPNYWRTEEAPKVKEIDYKFITNTQSAGDALLSGELDGTYDAPLASWETLSSSDAGNAYVGNSIAFAGIDFTEKEGPTKDVNLRKALLYSINRDAIAEAIYHGSAEAVRSQFFPTTWGYAEDVYKKGYEELPDTQPDLEKAKELVAKVKDLRPMTMLSNADDTASKQLAAYVQSEAKKAGIDLVIKELPAAQYISTAFDKEQLNQYDISLSTTGYMDLAEPVEWGVVALRSDGVFNGSGYSNPKVDQWTQEARETTDPNERAELMVKVEEQAYAKDVASIPLVNNGERLFMNKDLTGAVPTLTPQIYAPWTANLGAAK